MVGAETDRALSDNLIELIGKMLPKDFVLGVLVKELTKSTEDIAQSWKLLAMFSELFLSKQGRKAGVRTLTFAL
jgi:hypothetical protein